MPYSTSATKTEPMEEMGGPRVVNTILSEAGPLMQRVEGARSVATSAFMILDSGVLPPPRPSLPTLPTNRLRHRYNCIMPRPVINTSIAEVLAQSSYKLDFPNYKSHDDDRRRTMDRHNWYGDPEILFLGYNPNNAETFTVLESGSVSHRRGVVESIDDLTTWLEESMTPPVAARKTPDKTSIAKLIKKYGLETAWWAAKTNPGWRAQVSSKPSGKRTTEEWSFDLILPLHTSFSSSSAERSLP